MTNTPEETRNKPDYYIHAIVPKGGRNRIGSSVGVAFYHKNAQGLNIILDAQPIPLDGRIELVAFKPKS